MISAEALSRGLVTPETLSKLRLESTQVITFGYVVQVIISLAIVFGLIWLSAKYIFPRMVPNRTGKLIEVKDHVMLEAGVSAYVIKVKDKQWLVAASNKNVVKIGEIEGTDEENDTQKN